jgi:hypothetical protein
VKWAAPIRALPDHDVQRCVEHDGRLAEENPGWGHQLAPPPLQSGDVVEMTVEGIGTIRNMVVPGAELPPVRPARPRPRTRKRTL